MGGPRPERISRLKGRVRDAFAGLVDAATRRGRRPAAPGDRSTLLAALLAVATRLLARSKVLQERRSFQDELVCAFDRLHADHGATARELCAALAISERTFRSWQHRPPKPPKPPKPSPPAPKDRDTGRFALE
jgi:hypothetical protein